MAKPWAPSHIAEVAKGLGIDLRISGDVKTALIPILETELRRITKEMEDQTLEADPDRKTLDDPSRTRLGFNRTKGMMSDNLRRVDSVAAAATVSANERLEAYLLQLLRMASHVAARERVGTIKNRHLEKALEQLGHSTTEISSDESPTIVEEDPIAEAIQPGTGGVLSPTILRDMSRRFGGLPLDNDALEELLLVYYDHAAEIQLDLQENLNAPGRVIDTLDRFQTLAMLGWMRRMLRHAGERAREQNARKISWEHIDHIDPWD